MSIRERIEYKMGSITEFEFRMAMLNVTNELRSLAKLGLKTTVAYSVCSSIMEIKEIRKISNKEGLSEWTNQLKAYMH